MKHLLITMTILFGGCSMHKMYPVGGAILGGGVGGALTASPVGGAVGAGVGYGAGKIASLTSEKRELIGALSKGDVSKLVELQMQEARDGGFFDGILDEFYGLLKVVCIGVILWNAVPILYTRYVHKKHANGIPKKT